FGVSGLRVVDSWLGYRMARRKGKRSSPLDEIGPERWTHTPELLQLLAIVEHTVAVTADAVELLDEVVEGPLVDPALLPVPTDAERKPPSS
ncbi:MAG: type ISP restriction/modification enzyme, partial [Acidimicrobiales bacterium]